VSRIAVQARSSWPVRRATSNQRDLFQHRKRGLERAEVQKLVDAGKEQGSVDPGIPGRVKLRQKKRIEQ
jgi:hypothetical protein